MTASNLPDNVTSPATAPDLLALVMLLQSELTSVKARLDALESKAKPPDERRRFPRSPVKVMVHLLTWRQYEVPIEGEVVDLSTGGFGLFADTVFVVDSYITVTPANNPLGPRVEARVKSRTPLGTRWRIGCEFVQPLSDEELRIFHDSESPTNPTD